MLDIKRIVVAWAIFAALVCGTACTAREIEFDGFDSTTGFVLNGSAAVSNTSDGSVLRLCPAVPSAGGSAFGKVTVSAHGFKTFFKFRITSPGGPPDGYGSSGADGLVFVVQSAGNALGRFGDGIGYAGITSSIGVEFDTWYNGDHRDPNSNHIGIDINGSVDHSSSGSIAVPVSPNFDNGQVWYAWVDYDGTTLEVRISQSASRPDVATISKQ